MIARRFLLSSFILGSFFLPAPAGAQDVAATASPAVTQWLAAEEGWQVEHRCNLLPPADHEQFWVDRMKMGDALEGSIRDDEKDALEKQAEEKASESAYPCDDAKTRALIDAAVAAGASFRASRK